MSSRILLVEDDEKLGAQIVGHLRRAGFEPTWCKDGDVARSEDPAAYALIVLDLMLPGTYGMDLLKRYRATSEVPVMILSAREDAADKVRALKLGADDYVTKPFWPDELLARISARLRRPTLERRDEPMRFGRLSVDAAKREARLDDVPLELTRVELDLLLALARRPGSPMTRAALVDAALDPEVGGNERTLDVHVSRLRKKLGPLADAIATVWGIGYKLVPPGEA